jgi:arginyl-tRNA--protein-N-Asp/Glu arginylyltransferase
MIHYSCDLCGKDLPAGSGRYTVRIEVFAAAEADSVEADLLNKPDEIIQQMLEKMEQMSLKEIEDGNYRIFRYDLCRQCQVRYLADPLGYTKELRRMHFDN